MTAYPTLSAFRGFLDEASEAYDFGLSGIGDVGLCGFGVLGCRVYGFGA